MLGILENIKRNHFCKNSPGVWLYIFLEQESESSSPRAQSSLPFVFANKVLLANSHIHCLHVAHGNFPTTTAQDLTSSPERPLLPMVLNTKIIPPLKNA